METTIAVDKEVGQNFQCLLKLTEEVYDGIAITDVDGIIQFVNAALVRMHGYKTKQEIIGKPIDIFHTKEHMETDVIAFIEETKRRGQLAGPMEHVRKDGSTFPAQLRMTTLRDEEDSDAGFIIVVTDMTVQNQLEKAVR